MSSRNQTHVLPTRSTISTVVAMRFRRLSDTSPRCQTAFESYRGSFDYPEKCGIKRCQQFGDRAKTEPLLADVGQVKFHGGNQIPRRQPWRPSHGLSNTNTFSAWRGVWSCNSVLSIWSIRKRSTNSSRREPMSSTSLSPSPATAILCNAIARQKVFTSNLWGNFLSRDWLSKCTQVTA